MNKHIFVVTIVLLYSFALGTVDERGCWTCSPGYAHWYDLGLPQPNDRCACMKATTQTTTKAPAPAPASSYDTRGCWTCPAGYTHWFNAGMPSAPGGDNCACVPAGNAPSTPSTTKASTPTTAAPTGYDTKGCWTCPSGYTHWFNAGMASAPGGDRCACVPSSSSGTTTKAPTSATTTKAPTPSGYDTRGCWTCSPGMTHWFNAGMASAPAGDNCACVTIGSGGGSTPSTPSAPSPNAPVPTAGAGYSGQMKRFIDAMTPNANTPGSISFSPGVAPYSPWNPPPLSLVSSLLDKLKTQTKFRTLMMYFIDYYTLNIVKEKGFQVLAIVDLTTGDNTNVINNAVAMAKQFPDTIIALACGNELGANNGMTDRVVQVVNQCVSGLKAGGVQQPVGSIDVFTSWCGGKESPCNQQWSAITNNLDWIGLNDYPWWTNVFSGNWPCTPVSQAAQKTLTSYQSIQSLYPNKPIVMTEFGWPTAPQGTSTTSPANVATGQTCGIANDANQKLMIQSTIDLFRSKRLPCNTFQAFGEQWKAQHYSFDQFWGICRGTAPYDCVNVPN